MSWHRARANNASRSDPGRARSSRFATGWTRWGWRARVRLWEGVALELYTPAELQEGTDVLLVGEPGFLRVVGPVATTPATATMG